MPRTAPTTAPPTAVAGIFEITSPSTGETTGPSLDVCGIGSAGTTVTVTFICPGTPPNTVVGTVVVGAGGSWCVTGMVVPECSGATVTANDGTNSDTITGIVVTQEDVQSLTVAKDGVSPTKIAVTLNVKREFGSTRHVVATLHSTPASAGLVANFLDIQSSVLDTSTWDLRFSPPGGTAFKGRYLVRVHIAGGTGIHDRAVSVSKVFNFV